MFETLDGQHADVYKTYLGTGIAKLLDNRAVIIRS